MVPSTSAFSFCSYIGSHAAHADTPWTNTSQIAISTKTVVFFIRNPPLSTRWIESYLTNEFNDRDDLDYALQAK